MKKQILIILIALIFQNNVNATTAIDSTSMEVVTVVRKKMTESEMIYRLKQIKEMDLTILTKSEKTSLRKEVETINKDLSRPRNGIFLSVGAIIVILLLIILL